MSDVLPEEVDSSSEAPPSSNGTNSTGGFDGFQPTWGSVNYTLPTLIVVALVLFIVIVATAFGNFLVVLALLKYRSLRTISNYLIGNLALGDFLLATTILPLSTVNECLGHWVFGRALCNAWLIMDALYCTASIWNILAISFDRFTATLYPIWYRERRSTKKAAAYIALVWLISCAICLPPVVGWNDLSGNYIYEGNVYKCIVFQTPSYVLYSACGSFYIPFVMTFVFYMAIFIALRDRMIKTRKARTSTTTTTATTTTTTTDKRKLESHQKTPDAKRQRPTSKSHRLQKEYRLELVRAEDGKIGSSAVDAADGSSARSLFGSDSDRERSASDVDADETTTTVAVTSRETEIARVTRDVSSVAGAASTSNADVIRRDGSVHGNGFVPMTSRHHVISDDAVNSGSSSSERPVFISASAKDETNEDEGQNVELSVAVEAARLNPVKSATVACTTEGVAMCRYTPSTKAAKQQQQQGRRGRYEQREMRATVRMAVIVAFFCGMWVGFFTVYVVDSWCGGGCIPRELYAFFFWLGYSNSSINPILYTIFNDDFRKAFVQIVGCHATSKTKR